MTVFHALVIVSIDTKDIEQMIRTLMAPYYSYLDVTPYKAYLDPADLQAEIEFLSRLPEAEIELLACDWEVDKDDLETLARVRLDWGDDWIDGVDEKGLYKITTYNTQGKWDFYRIVGGENIQNPYQIDELPEVLPYAIVTPDGQWHEIGEEAGLQAFANELAGRREPDDIQVQWKQNVQLIMKQYSKDLAVALFCHD